MANLEHFAIMDIAYTYTPSSLTITLPTNNPCHLTCYYTDKQPLKHHSSRIIRGLEVPWGVYFCFVAWKAVEQNEAGDTLVHTFLIPAWSYCQTKWFTFRGTIGGLISPSVGPIFQHHHPGYTLPEVLLNLSFDIWLDPLWPPVPWAVWWVGSGSGSVIREDVTVHESPYAAKLKAAGGAYGFGLRQTQDPAAWLGMNLTFKAWAFGLPHPMNRLTVGVDGTGAWLRHAAITRLNDWEQLSISGIIPNDATNIRMDVLGWSPGIGPTYTRFDEITVERNW